MKQGQQKAGRWLEAAYRHIYMASSALRLETITKPFNPHALTFRAVPLRFPMLLRVCSRDGRLDPAV